MENQELHDEIAELKRQLFRKNARQIEQINERDTLSTEPWVPGEANFNSNYSPVNLSEQAVYDMALLGLTHEEIAGMFGINRNTLAAHFSQQLALGKAHLKAKPRRILNKMVGKLEANMDAGPIDDCKTNNTLLTALSMLEKHSPETPATSQAIETKKLTDEEIKAQIKEMASRL